MKLPQKIYLYEWRLLKGFKKQKELAKKLGVSQQLISNVEKGKKIDFLKKKFIKKFGKQEADTIIEFSGRA